MTYIYSNFVRLLTVFFFLVLFLVPLLPLLLLTTFKLIYLWKHSARTSFIFFSNKPLFFSCRYCIWKWKNLRLSAVGKLCLHCEYRTFEWFTYKTESFHMCSVLILFSNLNACISGFKGWLHFPLKMKWDVWISKRLLSIRLLNCHLGSLTL